MIETYIPVLFMITYDSYLYSKVLRALRYLFFYNILSLFLYCTSYDFVLHQMAPTISKSVQKQIQMFLASSMTYEQVMECIPGLKKFTLGRYANKFFPTE